jgi:hypothetical protein
MERTDEEKIDHLAPIAAMSSAPDFPHGLRISLTQDEFEKLDLDHTAAEVGGMVHGHFMGRLTSVSQHQRDDKATCCVEIQIEDLGIECEDDENEEEE